MLDPIRLDPIRPPPTTAFAARLTARCRAADTLLCVGLDPHPEDLPEPTAAAAAAWCVRLIEATAPFAAMFKPNAAFFEAFGPDGVAALRDVIAAVPADIPVLLDAKRGDIGSTSAAYARAAFEVLGADAITVHGWMGEDSVAPFVTDPARGAFVLCRTSNPGAASLLDLPVHAPEGGDLTVATWIAAHAPSWGAPGQVGLVVGATAPDALQRVRRAAPDAWILAPGVGAQGGSLDDAITAGLRDDGLGLLLPVSRAISRAEDPAAAAADLTSRIRAARAARVAGRSTWTSRDPIADGLLDAGCVQFGAFTLKSGLTSPIYLDLRRLVGFPRLLADVAAAYARVLADLSYDLVAPLPYAAMPIGTAVSLRTGDPMVYPRKEVKAYGTKAAVEGVFEPGQRAVVLDDLATTGESKLEGIARLEHVGLAVTDVVVLIDRQSGAREAMAAANLRMHSVYTITELMDRWRADGRIDAARDAEVRAFLRATGPS